MLPNRPRLQGWDPGSLATTGPAVQTSGAAVRTAVEGIEKGVANLSWSGLAHDAAVEMFIRSGTKAQNFSDYASDVGKAISAGSEPIGTARTNLLNKAAEIEAGGELYVNDQWVVLITPAEVSAEKAAALERDAQTKQTAINGLLITVDLADTGVAQKIKSAAEAYGFSVPPGAVAMHRVDQGVPDPLSVAGVMQQGLIRDTDNAQIVREKTVDDSDPRMRVTTLTMMDGSSHVITEDSKFDPYHKGTITEDRYYDSNGNLISTTGSFTDRSTGTQHTTIIYPNGTQVDMSIGRDRCWGEVRTRDGRRTELPINFFEQPIPDIAGTALTGLEHQAGKGIPGLSPEVSARIEAGARYAGPALGMATMLYDALTIEDAHAACVAVAKDGASTVGGMVTAAGLTAAFPELPGIGVVLGSAAGGYVFGRLGEMVGEMACPSS